MKDEIVQTARQYLGVPFVHQGRNEDGLDCLGLLIIVAKSLELIAKDGAKIADYDELNYSRIPDEDRLLSTLQKCLRQKETAPQIGDIALLRIDGNAQHLAIIGDYSGGGLSLIHAYSGAGRVVEHNFAVNWQRRIVALFEPNNQ